MEDELPSSSTADGALQNVGLNRPEEGKATALTKAKPVSRKKKRKLKPEDFPKRPLSAYNIFFKENRARLLAMKESGDGNESADLSMVKHISNLWKNTSSEERTRVEQMAKDDMQRYKEEVRTYEERLATRHPREPGGAAGRGKKVRQKDKRAAAKTPAESPGLEQQSLLVLGRAKLDDHHAGGRDDRTAPTSNVPPREWVEDHLQKLLADEKKAIDLAQQLKFEQLKLIQQVQAANPDLQLLASQDAKRLSMGLPPLVRPMAAEQDGSNVSGWRSIGEGGGRIPSATSGSQGLMSPFHVSPANSIIGQGPVGPLVSRDYVIVPDPPKGAHGLKQWRGEEAMSQLRQQGNPLLNDFQQQQQRYGVPIHQQDYSSMGSEMLSQNARLGVGGSTGAMPTNPPVPTFGAPVGVSRPPHLDVGNFPSNEIHHLSVGGDDVSPGALSSFGHAESQSGQQLSGAAPTHTTTQSNSRFMQPEPDFSANDRHGDHLATRSADPRPPWWI